MKYNMQFDLSESKDEALKEIGVFIESFDCAMVGVVLDISIDSEPQTFNHPGNWDESRDVEKYYYVDLYGKKMNFEPSEGVVDFLNDNYAFQAMIDDYKIDYDQAIKDDF